MGRWANSCVGSRVSGWIQVLLDDWMGAWCHELVGERMDASMGWLVTRRMLA